MPNKTLVTVAILTFNGEKYLTRLLEAVFSQEIQGGVDVLVIDSGSTDSTLQIVKQFPSVRLHEIPNSEFGHGRTRNLAAQIATGEFIAFLTHDAIPLGRDWLRELLAPFYLNDRIVAVLGRQAPRASCFPLQKYDISGLFEGLGSNLATSLFYDDPQREDNLPIDALSFFSDVNSASRRLFLTKVIPYRDVSYAEDQLYGKDVVGAGYIKAYAGRATVEHSNDLTFSEFGKRIFDETVGLRRIGFDIRPLGLRAALQMAANGIIRDSFKIARDASMSRKRKVFWLFINPAYHAQKWHNYRRSTLVNLDDAQAVEAGSLEHSRRKSRP